MGGKTSSSIPPQAVAALAQHLAARPATTAPVGAAAKPAPTAQPLPVARGKGSTPLPVARGEGSTPLPTPHPELQHFAAGGTPDYRHQYQHRFVHAGPIHSSVAGRTDHLPMKVPSGSYVIPADIVSAMGEGNTIAGFKHLRRMFSGNPYGGGAAPYNQESSLPYGAHMAKGGETGSVPIVAAGGEHVLSPEQVREVGGGDLERGHRVLDKWVLTMRKELIKTLKKLPGRRRE